MTPIPITDSTLLSLSAAVALRQLSRLGVRDSELDSLRRAVTECVEAASPHVRRISVEEARVLGEIPEEIGEDRETASLVLTLSVYAELGCRVADKIQKRRLAEAN